MAFRHALFALLPLPRIYRRRVWHPCHTHAALSGGAAVSAAPTEHSCTNIVILTRNSQKLLGRRASHRFHRCPQMVRLRRVLPRNSRNSQKLLAEKSLPQMRTDAHRWLGCVGFSHGIHGIHRSFWRRRASHRCHRWFGCVGFSHGIHGIHRNEWWRRASHGCSQMVWLRMVLPQISQNTDVLSGGAAVSAAPTEHSCTNIVILPRKSQNTQKLLA